MAKIAKGVLSAVPAFLVVGIGIPYLIGYFRPQILTYIKLPAQDSIWVALIAIGALLAVMGYLQTAYSKGDFPWLFGKLGNGIVNIGLFIYMYSLLPSSLGSLGSAEIQTSNLIYLVYLAVALSYGYLIMDFWVARRKKRGA